jgi:phage terminase large subunit-like protein
MVCRVRDAGLLPEKHAIGVDAAGIGDIVDELTSDERGFEAGPDGQIIAIGQGWRLNGAIKTTERKIAGGEMLHGDQPMMAWCVGNARVEQQKNAISINKQVSGTAKIDPLMGVFDAVTLMSLNPAANGKSFWES